MMMESEAESAGTGMEDKQQVIDTWLEKHRVIYTGATRHPFILSIRDGSVDLSSFKTWLGQDYVFVRKFVAFVAGVLMKASKESGEGSADDVDVVLAGMAALHDEIAWFKNEAPKWNVELSAIVPQIANLDYCRFLESLMDEEVDYAVAITAYWAIEAVYQESFAHCLEEGNKTPQELSETCTRWGNEGFGCYCASLKQIADRGLRRAPDEVLRKAEAALLRVLQHEVEFWNMSQAQS